MKTFEYITYEVLIERHPNIPDVTINHSDQEIIKYYPSDVTIDGDLSLDDEDSEDISISDLTVHKGFDTSDDFPVWIHAIYIIGNLTVNGNISNLDGNTGTGIYVQGTTKANNIFAGGSCFRLNEVCLKGICIGFYNDGMLCVNSFKKGIFLEDGGHHTEAKIEKTAIGFSSEEYRKENSYPMKHFYNMFKDKGWFDIEEEDNDEEEELYILEDVLMQDIINEMVSSDEINRAIENYKKNLS
jgi:hypothetical protein